MKIKIAVGIDRAGWHQKFSGALDRLSIEKPYIIPVLVDLERSDWMERIIECQAVIWNPHYMGLRLASHFKEKIYFMEKILGKIVFPNYETIWHFESKVAENHLFRHFNINTPKTYMAFNFKEAQEIIDQIQMPIVLKKSEGAGSRNVRLIRSKKWLRNYSQRVFCSELWGEARRSNTKINTALRNLTKKWFWYFIVSQYLPSDSGMGVIYLQEFIPNNDADLRITVIGDQYAYGFWRKNRPNDFRASGSGNIDYETEIPMDALNYCQQINKRLHFDSMAYDIIFDYKKMVITEMSYNYLDRVLYNTPGYYRLDPDPHFIQGHVWPQELWVRVLLDKLSHINAG